MMNQEEFNKTVRAMKAEGIALSMPNLMVRTELPRATIEDWLEELDHPIAKGNSRTGEGSARRPSVDPADDVAGALFDRMTDLKNDLARTAATAMVKDRLGIDDDVERVTSAPLAANKMKDLRWGAGLGLLGGPLGLFYSAPYPVAGLATVGYIALWALSRIPIFGTPFGYLLAIAHLAAALAGAAYTWRYNRTGKRSALVPDNGGRRRRRRED